jgi:glucose/arabinose dehydrogenase
MVFTQFRLGRLTNLVQSGERIFVTEQTGRIVSFPRNPDASAPTSFLDIRDRVSDSGNEEGLLGFVFDPEFDSNGHFFVYYSAASPRRSVISRFTATDSSGQSVADPDSELVVLQVPQPFSNHNGGQLAFGPDGMLYISLGDGGSGGDPNGNGQNKSTLLGSILRIDVSSPSAEKAYAVPADNPFVGSSSAKGEVWAYGLRNPWRFSFDQQNGNLWAGDVGQNSFEEINLIEKGGNYGWNTLEGKHCYSPKANCDPSGTTLPVVEYGASNGCSVIGGYVYRGLAIPELAGNYIYGDYCSGLVRGFRYETGEAVGDLLLVNSGVNITSFAEDGSGEIYALSQDGRIYLLTSMAP